MPHEENNNNIHDVVTLFEWHSAGRPYKKRTKQYFLTALLLMVFVELILFLFSQYMLMVVVISLVFVSFALTIVPPKDFHYKISSEGIMIEDRFFLWKELYDFYFKKTDGVETVHIRTEDFFPGEIILTLNPLDKENVKKAIIQFLPFREVIKPTFVEKSADWLSRNFPMEK